MDIALKRAHGAGYTFLRGFMLVVATLVMSGCPFAQKQYVTEKEITTEDGTVIPAGTPIYEDAEGNPTTTVTDTPLMETDVEKLSALNDTAGKVTSNLPYGIGGIIGAIAGAALMAAANSRKKKRAEVDAKLKTGKKTA